MSNVLVGPRRPLFTRTVGLLCALLLTLLASLAAPALTGNAAAQPYSPAHAVGVLLAADGQLQLGPDAALPPASLAATYDRYGFYEGQAEALTTPTARLTVQYEGVVPAGTALMVDVRASADGTRWSAWQTDVQAGAAVDLPVLAQLVQYRVRLFGSADVSPTLGAIQVSPIAGFAPTAQQDEIAPTYRIRATRLGLVGWRTANGHIIQPRDHFVALPSWQSLSSRNGSEYQVRISYQGRSVVAPVWDVGPWNTRDNYWATTRERYGELQRGWPQDHAAYFNDHNNGFAEKGYVIFPTAMDVADGIWWDHLGIVGDQAEVEVTFLWEGHDPLALPEPEQVSTDPNASAYVVDERGTAFVRSQQEWGSSPYGCGEGQHAFWTLTTTDEAAATHEGFWQPALPVGGLYDVYAHVPLCPHDQASTTAARYLIVHADGSSEVVVNQATQTAWVHLGRFPFAAGDAGFVHLPDLAGDAGQALWFDSVKWVPAGDTAE